MITEFKLFEMLGIDDITPLIMDKVWTELEKAIRNKKTEFEMDISDLKLITKINRNISTFNAIINYDVSFSTPLPPIGVKLGVYGHNMLHIKGVVAHEIRHLIDTYKKKSDKDRMRKEEKHKKHFFNQRLFYDIVLRTELYCAFETDKNSNLLGEKMSLNTYLKYNNRTEQFKKMVSYLYLSDDSEFTAFIHEFYAKIKGESDFNKVKNSDSKYEMFKDMKTFNINWEDFSTDEKEIIQRYIFKKQDTKKMQDFINKKGRTYIQKIDRLRYYEPNKE
jgi:hypothetical protein